jgi:hypothetical protein
MILWSTCEHRGLWSRDCLFECSLPGAILECAHSLHGNAATYICDVRSYVSYRCRQFLLVQTARVEDRMKQDSVRRGSAALCEFISYWLVRHTEADYYAVSLTFRSKGLGS